MAYGVNKFGERLKHVGVIDDELNMNGNKIVGLPTYIGELAGEGDAVSKRILLDVLDRLNNILLRTNGTNRMTGDLLMNSSNNDSVSIVCIDFGTEEKSFLLWLGNLDNVLAYNTLIQSQPVTLYTSNGFLVKVGNRNITRFNANEIDVSTDININGKYIYNLSPPLHEYDATVTLD